MVGMGSSSSSSLNTMKLVFLIFRESRVSVCFLQHNSEMNDPKAD